MDNKKPTLIFAVNCQLFKCTTAVNCQLFNESGVRFYAGVLLLPKNPYPLNFKSYQSPISCKNLFNSGSDKLLR